MPDESITTPPEPPQQETSRKNPLFNFFFQFAVVGILFFVLGFAAGRRNFEVQRKGIIPQISVSNQYSQNQTIDFSLFWKVFETLPEKYIDKTAIDAQELLYGAISGMVRSVGDPYTVFLNPQQNQTIKDELSGSFEGVGIQIGFDKDKRLVVIAPLKGTPAERAGILPRDLILKIDDKVTFDMTLPEAVELIRGKAGTKVKLVLQHPSGTQTYEKEIERAKIDVKSVEISFTDDNIAVIKVSRFGEKTDEEWDKAVSDVVEKRAKAVVVDMRNNPGGLLSSSIHLASEFTRGIIVKQQFADGSVQNVSATREGKLLRIPLSVVINGGSASAAEIFAGAIQDNNRGKIIGEKSFGKGTVQDVVDYPGGAGLHVTIAKWLTPDGKSIHGEGITPDITEEIAADADPVQLSENDPQLNRALEELR